MKWGDCVGAISHQQLKKTGLSETHQEVKQRVDQLEDENRELICKLEDTLDQLENIEKENKKLKSALRKLEKENEKLKNPPVWMNDGEL